MKVRDSLRETVRRDAIPTTSTLTAPVLVRAVRPRETPVPQPAPRPAVARAEAPEPPRVGPAKPEPDTPPEAGWLAAVAAALAADPVAGPAVAHDAPEVVSPPELDVPTEETPTPDLTAEAVTDFDDEDEYRDESDDSAGHHVLGATRRVSRIEVERVAEPTQDCERPPASWEVDPCSFGGTDWGGWGDPAPFVTDTNLGDPLAATVSARASDRRAADLRDSSPPVGRPAAEARGARASEREWPTVSDILAARGVRPGQTGDKRPAAKGGRATARPVPTVSVEPGHWRLPLWLGWVPTTAAAVGVSVAGMAGAWTWSRDAYNAGVVARRLAAGGRVNKPLPKGVVPPGGRWWETTAPHLLAWSAYLDRTADDPARAEDARTLLARAAQASPLNATVRHAVARTLPGESPSPAQKLALGLGQSRDVLTLAWAGHQLLEAGRREAALGAYRDALAMAAAPDAERPDAPAFLEDTQPRRYALPTEERLAAVIRDMADAPAWSYKDWSAALPRGTAAAVVAARVLRDKASPDADAALDTAVAEAEAEPEAPAVDDATAVPADPAHALRLAAGAAALAMKQRWPEASDRYLRAIDRMPDDSARRAWWVNVSDLAQRLNEDAERRVALDAAKNADPKDEITQRAVDLQKAAGFVAQRSAGGTPTRTSR
jgi:hypothetical protein